MSEPERTPHSTEPAEGDEAPGRQVDARPPHSHEPAEGPDEPADQPESD